MESMPKSRRDFRGIPVLVVRPAKKSRRRRNMLMMVFCIFLVLYCLSTYNLVFRQYNIYQQQQLYGSSQDTMGMLATLPASLPTSTVNNTGKSTAADNKKRPRFAPSTETTTSVVVYTPTNTSSSVSPSLVSANSAIRVASKEEIDLKNPVKESRIAETTEKLQLLPIRGGDELALGARTESVVQLSPMSPNSENMKEAHDPVAREQEAQKSVLGQSLPYSIKVNAALPKVSSLWKPLPNISQSVKQQEVTFLMLGEIDRADHFSGMWWQSLDRALTIDTGNIRSRQSASLVVLNDGRRVRMSQDYLDFAVEHLSEYYEHFRGRDVDGFVFNRTLERLRTYIENVSPSVSTEASAPKQTIAIVPFFLDKAQLLQNKDGAIKRMSLVATLASLWQLGIGRAVVVVQSVGEETAVKAVFGSFSEGQAHTMQLAVMKVVVGHKIVLVGAAIHGLQMAAKGNLTESEVGEWLGVDPFRWKYVYYTEPDLVLNSRAGAVPSLSVELDRGSVLTAHRLKLVPHESDLQGYQQRNWILPAVGVFSSVESLNAVAGDVCCDAGNQRPAHIVTEPACNMDWFDCGFGNSYQNLSDPAVVMNLHSRKAQYKMVRLTRGTGITIIAGNTNARQCVPIKNGSCNVKAKQMATVVNVTKFR
jgi:hypothetical protein